MSTQYDPAWVREFYDAYGMKEWDRWDLSPLSRVSWAVHLHYLRAYVRPDERVLEMGAGAGRFTQALAEITPRVTVADISRGQLDLNARQALSLGFEHAVERRVECDVCDLHGHFADGEFDTTVCYGGVLSYVYDCAPAALSELRRVTRPGGWIVVEVMSLWGVIHSALMEVLNDISPETNRKIVSSGDLTPDMAVSNHFIHMYRAGELRKVLENSKLEVEAMSATGVLSVNWGKQLADIPEDSEQWRHLIEMELEACREPGCLDMSTHIIAVCRKAGG